MPETEIEGIKILYFKDADESETFLVTYENDYDYRLVVRDSVPLSLRFMEKEVDLSGVNSQEIFSILKKITDRFLQDPSTSTEMNLTTNMVGLSVYSREHATMIDIYDDDGHNYVLLFIDGKDARIKEETRQLSRLLPVHE